MEYYFRALEARLHEIKALGDHRALQNEADMLGFPRQAFMAAIATYYINAPEEKTKTVNIDIQYASRTLNIEAAGNRRALEERELEQLALRDQDVLLR